MNNKMEMFYDCQEFPDNKSVPERIVESFQWAKNQLNRFGCAAADAFYKAIDFFCENDLLSDFASIVQQIEFNDDYPIIF